MLAPANGPHSQTDLNPADLVGGSVAAVLVVRWVRRPVTLRLGGRRLRGAAVRVAVGVAGADHPDRGSGSLAFGLLRCANGCRCRRVRWPRFPVPPVACFPIAAFDGGQQVRLDSFCGCVGDKRPAGYFAVAASPVGIGTK